MNIFIFSIILSLLSIPSVTADFGPTPITKELSKKEIIHSACCHWCRLSMNRNSKKVREALGCPKCNKIYCSKCIKEDKAPVPTEKGCMFCLEKCCCYFTQCNKQHNHCHTYRRTIVRHQKTPNMKVYKKNTKYNKASIKCDSDESDESDEPYGVHEPLEFKIICLHNQKIISRLEVPVTAPSTVLEDTTLSINKAISFNSIEINTNNGFVDRDLSQAEIRALSLAGSTVRIHIQHGCALLQLYNPFHACATFDLSENKLEFPMIFKQHPLRIIYENLMGEGKNWLTDDSGKTHDLDQVLLAAIKFEVISSDKSFEEKNYYQKQILTLEESSSLEAFTDIGPHGDTLCNFYPEKNGTHRLVVIKIEPALIYKIFNQFFSMHSINISQLRYDISLSSLESGIYYCSLGELRISPLDSRLIFLDPYLTLEFDLSRSPQPQAKKFRPDATWLAEYLPHRGVILRSIQGHEIQLDTIINSLTNYFGMDASNTEYESATCDCTPQGQTTIILRRLANKTYKLAMVQIPEEHLLAIFMQNPQDLEPASYTQQYLRENQPENK